MCASRFYPYPSFSWYAVSRSAFGRQFLLVIIIMLYLLATIGFSFDWVFLRRAFIGHGDNFYTVFQAAELSSPWWIAYQLVDGITGGIGTFLVDITMVCSSLYYFILSLNIHLRYGVAGSFGTDSGGLSPYPQSVRLQEPVRLRNSCCHV